MLEIKYIRFIYARGLAIPDGIPPRSVTAGDGGLQDPEKGMIMSTTFLSTRDWAATEARTRFSPSRLVAYIELVLQVRRERRQLAGMSSAQLADLGLDPGAARCEARRGLFDLPASRSV
jgi:uncharacterized protein YjiS (DUF1127 family)